MLNHKSNILVVDDEKPVCRLLCDDLVSQGYSCAAASTGEEALTKLGSEIFNLTLLDIRLPDISGIEVLKKISSDYRDIAAIMITAVNDVDTAVESMKLGASDYIVKPFNLDRIDATVRTVLENRRCPEEGQDLQPLAFSRNHRCGTTESFRRIEAIAEGVEARLDLESSHSDTVIKRTTSIARYLGISEEEIQEWAAVRSGIFYERLARIRATHDKLRRNPLARIWLGLTESDFDEPESHWSQS